VNGDAGLNIGDPIYLLQHLFQGGPGPVACAQTTPNDIAAAIDAALAKYEPRAGERDFIIQFVATGPSDVVLVSVPPSRVFRITGARLDAGELHLNGQPFYGVPLASAGYPEPLASLVDLVPGDTLSAVNQGGGSGNALVWGYWLDYTP
jgi:hypothetical protein